jgi:hypothetical protein
MSSSVVADHFLPGRSVKWEITNLFRLVEGVLVIFCEFITIIQSEVALDLWMNFAAVAFVGELDDMGFKLAQHQFIDDTAKRVADRVGRVKVHKKKATTGIQRFIRRFTRFLMFFGLAAVLWIGLAVVQSYQDGQKFTCKSVYLSVGEFEGAPWVRYYSGLYEIENSTYEDKADYYKFDHDNYNIYYDKQLSRWIITDDGGNFDLVSSLNWSIRFIRSNYILPHMKKSHISQMTERTTNFDISDVEDIFFYSGEPADASIRCVDCNPKRGVDDCSWNGSCNNETFKCECDPGFFGEKCQFRGPCTMLSMNEEFTGKNHGWQKDFHLLYLEQEQKPVLFLDRPAYYQELASDSDELGVII